ncbi:MAG: cobalt-precorrin-6A reductase [Rhodospirillales bacterium]|nr:cobalt-precorrin-6A reductase [Rhodospirillales bacterium]
MKLLLLGGTAEGSGLARLLAGRPQFQATLSLAGRTERPATNPLLQRTGGFGGVIGLCSYLFENKIDVLIDATHPYAAQMSRNAAMASRRLSLPLLALRRPPWQAQAGDRWQTVADAAAAAEALGTAPRRVFLAMGRLEVAAFAAAPQHDYLLRSVDRPGPLPLPRLRIVTARGPFAEAEEEQLLRQERIEVIVSKNSGGTATYGKIAAARRLGLPVILLQRPILPEVESVATPAAAIRWLDTHHAADARRGV